MKDGRIKTKKGVIEGRKKGRRKPGKTKTEKD